jgi:aconitate hydratase
MIKLIDKEIYYFDGKLIEDRAQLLSFGISEEEVKSASKGTISYKILSAHNEGDDKSLKLKADCLASHDITYVGVIQTARASGLKEFSVPYALTNCHNSLCAVGGTINEDDHVFGLSAAKKYGGIFVPPHIAVIHQYAREMMASCGSLIIGSDSHTRYGALGAMGIGEGGPEIVKQLLGKTYDIPAPEVVACYLYGKVRKGVGPQDVALAIIGAVFKNGFVKNRVIEFIGEGIHSLSVDFRSGVDVMTTETACLSSIWVTDGKVKEYYERVGRPEAFRELKPDRLARYDRVVAVDLSRVEPMIAIPFHPSNVYKLCDVIENPGDILRQVERSALENENIKVSLMGKVRGAALKVDQGIIAGCAGGIYENIMEAAAILEGKNVGNGEFSLSVYPASQPIYLEIVKNGAAEKLISAGAIIKTAFCGPCFGAGDVPANNAFSVRHTTRNFPNREGSKPGAGQIASVALMDARSIAATAANGGVLTSAIDLDYDNCVKKFSFDGSIYKKRVYNGFGRPDPAQELILGPNIADWPKMIPLPDNVLLRLASVIFDPVTTTDELIPSGETSSYRSNPLKLAEFALSRKDPGYVQRAKAIQEQEDLRRQGKEVSEEIRQVYDMLGGYGKLKDSTLLGSAIFAVKPGDGSAREQAASCQRVLGGVANVATEYATKRYRSNLINWGMLPLLSKERDFNVGDFLFIENIRESVKRGDAAIKATLIREGQARQIELFMDPLTETEKEIILEGCLINYYAKGL